MYSIHFFYAGGLINKYCLYYVTKTEYSIIKVFSTEASARIYSAIHHIPFYKHD